MLLMNCKVDIFLYTSLSVNSPNSNIYKNDVTTQGRQVVDIQTVDKIHNFSFKFAAISIPTYFITWKNNY